IARFRRMNGQEVLFLPGYDHAAIATQNVIEKQLSREGTTKEELGRDGFAARVEAWYEQVGATIINQLRLLGASMDWSRLRFTMDSKYVRSVMTAFVAFYDRGWIYRAPRIVNWCPHDRSAISDLEIEWEEHQDGSMNVPGLPYDGLPALQARQRVVDDLMAQGLLVKEEPYTHEVGHCDRCHTVIEPLISEQWWLQMDEMRDRALDASEAGKVRWHPERYE